MALEAGRNLQHYRIVEQIGAGGMGVVYRARDTRLGREVAIKVLPDHLSASQEVRARFEREARTVSALNHPHICTLFDVGREDDTDFIVMELVEGESLAARLQRGALPTADVLRIGAQMADALDKAHRAGIVHRDLKPGNIMITRSGAKLMDFGLARAADPPGTEASAVAGLSQTPTRVQPITAHGSIVGTFQYMAPEQLEGREADPRSDLWALGCVLYEMATGRAAFEARTQASLVGSIMRDTPRALGEIVSASPPLLERLIEALLAKDPDERVQTAHDVKLQLQWAMSPSGPVQAPAVATAQPRRWMALGWIAAAIAAAVAVAAWLPSLRGDRGPAASRVRLVVSEPGGAHFPGSAYSFPISPDGRTLLFVAADGSGSSRLWSRPLDSLTARPLEGTENADQPFWSPDGRFIAFFADGKLKRVAAEGGRAEELCDAPDPRGGAWGTAGTIVFAPFAAGPLYTVASDGGPATELLQPDAARGETAFRFPSFLPDGRRFVFVSLPVGEDGYPVHLGTLGSGERSTLMRAGAAPVFAEPGWLVTVERERLVAWPLDARSGKLSGKPLTLGAAPLVLGHDAAPAASVSRGGPLVYWGGTRSNTQLAWLDRTGRLEHTFALPTGRWEYPSVSPDGARAIVSKAGAPREADLWLVDLATGQASRFTFGPGPGLGFSVVWSPDGRRVVYSSSPRGPAELLMQSVAGGEPEVLHRSETLFKNAYAWSPDGKYVTFEEPDRKTGWDVWIVPVDGDRKPRPLVRTPANEGGGCVSPDGGWFGYVADEGGSYDLRVMSFPEPDVRHSLPGMRSSEDLGRCYWSNDGREILLVGDGMVRAIDVEAGATFRSGAMRVLFRYPDEVIGVAPAPDHRRFLATVRVGEAPPSAIVVDLDWQASLETR